MSSKKPVIVSVLIMVAGLGWLLNSLHVIESVNWVWTLSLGAVGAVVLFAGIDKVSIIVGPLLIIGAACSLLRQTGRLSIEQEAPALVIAFGALLLLSHLLPVPVPGYLRE